MIKPIVACHCGDFEAGTCPLKGCRLNRIEDKNLQELLDESARLGNAKYLVDEEIKKRRGNTPPPCWGEDDCSTEILSRCPWRIDCGKE